MSYLHAAQVKARRYSKRISSVVLLFYCLLEQFCEVQQIQSESFLMVDKSFYISGLLDSSWHLLSKHW